jgi:hypothetical protein
MHTPFLARQARLLPATADALASGSFILGPEVEAFKREFAAA